MKRTVERQAEASERKKLRDAISPREQLNKLDELLGKGKGARKERARLQRSF